MEKRYVAVLAEMFASIAQRILFIESPVKALPDKAFFPAMMLASVTDKSYDQMTHDEILRVHGDAYLRMTPEQRLQAAAEAKERLLRHYAEQKELNSPRNKKLSEVTLGEVMDELGTVGVKFLIRIAFFVVGWFVVVWLAKYLGLMH